MKLTANQLAQMIEQARRDAPYETCGLVAGKDNRAVKLYPVKNIADFPETRYMMDGTDQVRAFMDMEEEGLELLAIYHSHPASPAYPSLTDLSEAYDPTLQEPLYPGVVYLIISLMNPDAPTAFGFLLDDSRVTEVPLEIVPDEQA